MVLSVGNGTSKKVKKKRNGKGIRGTTTVVAPSRQSPPSTSVERDPMLWKKTMVMTPQGYKKAKWTRRASPKKALPLSKSVKKGSPRSYENLKKAKPLGRKRKNGIG